MTDYQDIRWVQRLSNYNKAVCRLQSAAQIILSSQSHNNDEADLLKEGLIQRFEYTQELAWKVMKDYEEYQGYTNVMGSRDAIRKALQIGLIDNDMWMRTISSRDLTSHYNSKEELTLITQQIIHDYLPIFIAFLEKAKKLNNHF